MGETLSTITTCPKKDRKSQKSSERGVTKLGVLFTVLCVSALVFIGYQVFPFYYCFYEIEGLMEEQARHASVFTDQEIRKNIMEKIKKLELPIESPEDLKINRFNGEIVIELDYSEVLYFEWKTYSKDLYVFNFHAVAKAPIETVKR